MNKTNTWCLLDLRGLILHAYHAGHDPDSEFDPDGNIIRSPGHTLDNFYNFYLMHLLQEYPLNRIIGLLDAGNEYRKTIYAAYKEHRKAIPQALVDATNRSQAVKSLLRALGIPMVSVPGTEADDVIAYFAARLPGHKSIYTVDGDLIALHSSVVRVYLRGRLAEVYSAGDIEVPPNLITLFKSLVGDTSDGYKGVPNFGPKAWLRLRETYGDDGLAELIEIVENQEYDQLRKLLADEPGQHILLDKISNHVAAWHVSWDCAKLHPELVDARQRGRFTRLFWDKRLPDRDKLARILQETGCEYLELQMERFMPQQYLIQAKDWDETTLDEARALFKESRLIAFDYETWSPEHDNFKLAARGAYVDLFDSRIAGVGITCGWNLEHTFYFAYDHADVENNLSKIHCQELLNVFPETLPLVIHNSQFELTVTQREFARSLDNVADTVLMASHVAEHDSLGLKDLSRRWLHYNQISYREVVPAGKTMRDIPSAEVFRYGADDAWVTAHLYDLFYTILCLEGTWEFVRDYECGFVKPLVDAYIDGVSLDWDEVERQHREDAGQLAKSTLKIRHLLCENQTPELVQQGMKNWEQELLLNYTADTRQLLACINAFRLEPPQTGLLAALEADKKLWAYLREVELEDWTPESSRQELTSLCDSIDMILTEERARGWHKHSRDKLSAVEYRDYTTEPAAAIFRFNAKCLNALAESVRLPGKFGRITVEALDHYPAQDLTNRQAVFIHQVRSVLQTKSHRTRLESYKLLEANYLKIASGPAASRGTELNLDSSLQMQVFLYGTLGLPIRLRTLIVSESRLDKGLPGSPQVDENAVRMAIAMGDAPQDSWQREVLEEWMRAKKCGTRIKFFYKKLPLWKHPLDGQIHPQFNSVGTETRRVSGSAPNLLQLSKRGEGIKIRRCFLPNRKLGHNLIVSIDWAGEELRILAGLSGDTNLTACYTGNRRVDVHGVTAANMAHIAYNTFMLAWRDHAHPEHKKLDDIRRKAKIVNFGSSYGIGKNKLARQLLCSPDQAETFLSAKKAAYPGIEAWRQSVKDALHRDGYVKTTYGSRKHVFNKLLVQDDGLIGYYERAAVNFLIQGVCADYLKVVFKRIHDERILERYQASLIASIYDELVLSCHSDYAVGLIQEVSQAMLQGIPGIDIPLLVMPSLGVNFEDQVDILENEEQEITAQRIEATINLVLKPTEKLL